jgi:lysozyme
MSNPIPQEAAEIIFRDDYKKALKCFFELPIGVRLTTSGPASYGLNVTRREVLVEMIFQLGLNGVLGFKKMIEALEAMDYEKAADEILDSKAARQCPERFQEYADLMRVG